MIFNWTKIAVFDDEIIFHTIVRYYSNSPDDMSLWKVPKSMYHLCGSPLIFIFKKLWFLTYIGRISAPTRVRCTPESSTHVRLRWGDQSLQAGVQGNTSPSAHHHRSSAVSKNNPSSQTSSSSSTYSILVRQVGSPSTSSARLVNVSFTEFSVGDLKPYTNYSLRVAGWSSVGPGPFSSPVYCKTMEAGK
jgi:hypothetical protein